MRQWMIDLALFLLFAAGVSSAIMLNRCAPDVCHGSAGPMEELSCLKRK